MNIYNYAARAEWAGNQARPKKIAQDFIQMVDYLDKIYLSPPGCTRRRWGVLDMYDENKSAYLDHYRGDFEKYVKHSVCTDENNRPDPKGGFWIFSDIEIEPVEVALGGSFGFFLCDGSPVKNEFNFEIGRDIGPPDPTRITYSFYKSALLSGLSIWPADWANVGCSLWGEDPAEACVDPSFPESGFQMPWMSYLPAKLAANVSVPTEIVTERTPDGGLLMIAAETRLDPMNVEHMKRSRILAEIMIEHVPPR